MEQDWTEEQVLKYVGDGNDTHVIPVNVAVAAGQRVLNFRAAEEILARADRIAVAECFCRNKMQRCEHTLEGCMFLGPWYEDAVEEGYARPATREEALAILKRTYDDGLVLVAAEADEGPFKICACCSCCCFQFAAMRKFGMKNALLTSSYVAAHDGELLCAVQRDGDGGAEGLERFLARFAGAEMPPQCFSRLGFHGQNVRLAVGFAPAAHRFVALQDLHIEDAVV